MLVLMYVSEKRNKLICIKQEQATVLLCQGMYNLLKKLLNKMLMKDPGIFSCIQAMTRSFSNFNGT